MRSQVRGNAFWPRSLACRRSSGISRRRERPTSASGRPCRERRRRRGTPPRPGPLAKRSLLPPLPRWKSGCATAGPRLPSSAGHWRRSGKASGWHARLLSVQVRREPAQRWRHWRSARASWRRWCSVYAKRSWHCRPSTSASRRIVTRGGRRQRRQKPQCSPHRRLTITTSGRWKSCGLTWSPTLSDRRSSSTSACQGWLWSIPMPRR
mmetsp:Transcript_37515/g.104306  ORF Transcript_37515/g.104306 Transcript_37515/m.104306 type:complete len:208 (-) Transcript_37515:379-1002(-)